MGSRSWVTPEERAAGDVDRSPPRGPRALPRDQARGGAPALGVRRGGVDQFPEQSVPPAVNRERSRPGPVLALTLLYRRAVVQLVLLGDRLEEGTLSGIGLLVQALVLVRDIATAAGAVLAPAAGVRRRLRCRRDGASADEDQGVGDRHR